MPTSPNTLEIKNTYRSLIALLFIAAFFILYFSATGVLDDADVPWHLASGHWILEHKQLPATDPWAFTSNNYPLYLVSWAWDVGIAVVDNAFGLHGLYALTVLCGASIIAFLAYALCARGIRSTDAILLTCGLATFVMLDFAYARPQLASYVCVLVFYHILHRSREGRQWKLALLPLIMLLWVDTHGSFPAGFIMLGAYGLEALWRRDFAWARALAFATFICGISVLANPYGIHVLDAIMPVTNSAMIPLTLEWMPFQFGKSMALTIWLIIFSLSLVFRSKQVKIADILLSLFWLTMMLKSIRHGSIFMLVSAPMLAMNLEAALTALERFRTKRTGLDSWLSQPRTPKLLYGSAFAVLLGGILISLAIQPARQVIPSFKDARPALNYMEEHYPDIRFLTDFSLTGQQIYYSQGRIKLFMDSRVHIAYPESVIEDFAHLVTTQGTWDGVLKKYHIQGMIMPVQGEFAAKAASYARSHSMPIVYEDKVARVYVSGITE